VDAVPTLYTAGEAATILRVRRSWLERQAAARKIPFTMLGGSYRFTTEHLARIVRIFESSPGPAASPQAPSKASTRGTSARATGDVAPLRPRPRNRQKAA
jgi:excisionase family DNA binding protein